MLDTHLHVYATDLRAYPRAAGGASPPSEPAEAADYLAAARRAGIEKAVLVQPSAYAGDTRYIRRVADEHPEVFRFVVIAAYRDDDGPAALERECDHPRMRGGRFNLTADNRPPETLAGDPALLRTLGVLAGRGRVADLHVNSGGLGLAAELAARFPETPFIVDHMGYPEPGGYPDGAYADAVRRLASRGNVYFKLSGFEMKSRTGFPFADMTEYAAFILETAGSRRCMWGSNYPFVNATAGIAEVLGRVREIVGPGAAADVFYETGYSLFWRNAE